jgi:hypothetical protein
MPVLKRPNQFFHRHELIAGNEKRQIIVVGKFEAVEVIDSIFGDFRMGHGAPLAHSFCLNVILLTIGIRRPFALSNKSPEKRLQKPPFFTINV